MIQNTSSHTLLLEIYEKNKSFVYPSVLLSIYTTVLCDATMSRYYKEVTDIHLKIQYSWNSNHLSIRRLFPKYR